MSEIKQINAKTIWVILKVYFGGTIEFSDAYWIEDEARISASKQLPTTGDTFTISIHSVTLHGPMVNHP